MSDYELVKNRIENRNNKRSLTVDEARRLFYDTTVSISENGWFAIMAESSWCENIQEAVDEALEYLREGGY